jgi:cytosine/adenosine deaminase-related metal-dependent hydrolase
MSSAFFSHRYQVQRRFFPGTGGLDVGMRADLAVLDYVPVAPLHLNNLLGHLIFGARAGKVYMTVAGGKIVYRDGIVTVVDEEEVMQRARHIARALHERYYTGGSFSRRGLGSDV